MGVVGWVAFKVSWLGSSCQCSGGWVCVSSLWSAMKCPVVSFELSVGLV